jgi:hypothetical protein
MKTDRELMTICEGWVGGRSPDKVESMTYQNLFQNGMVNTRLTSKF